MTRVLAVLYRSLHSRHFELLTFYLGGCILLLSCVLLPFGQHRLWIRASGWWWFPLTATVSYVGSMLSFQLGGHTENPLLVVFSLPFVAMFFVDAWLILHTELPCSTTLPR